MVPLLEGYPGTLPFSSWQARWISSLAATKSEAARSR